MRADDVYAMLNKKMEEGGSGGVPTNHASKDPTYGVGDVFNYGHLKLTNTIGEYGVEYGRAVTPYVVWMVDQNAYKNYISLCAEAQIRDNRIYALEQKNSSSSSSNSVKLLWEGDAVTGFTFYLSNNISTKLLESANVLLLINGYWEHTETERKELVSASYVVGFRKDETYYKNTSLYFKENEISGNTNTALFIALNPGEATIQLSVNTDVAYHLTNIGMITMEK